MTKSIITTALLPALVLTMTGPAQARFTPAGIAGLAAAPHTAAFAHRAHPHLRTTEHTIIQHRPTQPPEHEEDPLATMHFE